MAPQAPSTVYIVVHRDSDAAATILGVFARLGDANDECLAQASQAGFRDVPHSGTLGDVAPLRWDAPEGVSCWVETHNVRPAVEPRADG